VIRWYHNTMKSRVNDPVNTPIIFIGQRVHESDLAAELIKSGDWEVVCIPALDIHDNALDPRMHDVSALLKMKAEAPYDFAAQYQQDPVDADNGLYKEEYFFLHDEEPKIIATFITADTAEEVKEINDYTAFSFWGIYKIKHGNAETDEYGLHWINCVQIRVEPKDIESEFMDFYQTCLWYPIKPLLAIIEKKSSGSTLISLLKKLQGLNILNFDRKKSKTQRFIDAQPYIAAKKVSLTRLAKHTHMCIEHCTKINANDSHRFDDIADTLSDAVQAVYMDKIILARIPNVQQDAAVANRIMSKHQQVLNLKDRIYGQGG
jgi:predicted phage terminase large subunit-like protein